MRLLSSKYAKNAFVAEAPPRTPLGELTALPGPSSWICGGEDGKGRGGEGMAGEGRAPETPIPGSFCYPSPSLMT